VASFRVKPQPAVSYTLEDDLNALIIKEAETTPEHLAYNGSRLVPLGGALDFQADAPLPITVTSVGQSYAVDYLFNANHGGGEYLEVHDRPLYLMPLDEKAGDHLIIGTGDPKGPKKSVRSKFPSSLAF